MFNPLQSITVLPAKANTDVVEAGIKQGDTLYLISEPRKSCFYVVRWERTRWVCSCGKSAREHRLAVNTFVFEQVRLIG